MPGKQAFARAKSVGPMRELLMNAQSPGKQHCPKIGGRAGIDIYLPFKSPYDWRSIIRFYRSHAITGVESVTDDGLERVFRIGNTIGFVRVGVAAGKQLKVRIVPDHPGIVTEVVRRLRKMFDLDCDPRLIAKHLSIVPLFATLCKSFPGLRLPRCWDPFETAVCSILGQLVSASQRANLIGQLVDNYGEEIVDPVAGEKTRLFPVIEVLASSDLSAVGTTIARRQAIRELARHVLSGAITFAGGQDLAAFRKALLEIKGLGPWSAEYISLRAIGDTDAFPKTDLILKRVLDLHPDLDLAQLTPWRSYAAMYLWKNFADKLSKNQRARPNDATMRKRTSKYCA